LQLQLQFDTNFFLSWVTAPDKCNCQLASKFVKRLSDDRQTDHATEKCVAISGIAYARAIPPSNDVNILLCTWWRRGHGAGKTASLRQSQVWHRPSRQSTVDW